MNTEAITEGWSPSSIDHKVPPNQRSKTVGEPTAGLGAADCSEKRDQPHGNSFWSQKVSVGPICLLIPSNQVNPDKLSRDRGGVPFLKHIFFT